MTQPATRPKTIPDDSAHCFFHEEQRDFRSGHFVTAGGRPENHQEDDDANPVVEERLPGDLHLETPGDAGLPDDREHGDGIRGRDQCAEEKAVDEGESETQRTEAQVDDRTDGGGGEQDADGRQEGHHPLLIEKVSEVDVQGAGEEQESEHALEKGRTEVDLREPRGPGLAHQAEAPEGDQDQREEQGESHHANRGRQPQGPAVQVGEERGQNDQQRDHVEEFHRPRAYPGAILTSRTGAGGRPGAGTSPALWLAYAVHRGKSR
jgi:hypothetical protein